MAGKTSKKQKKGEAATAVQPAEETPSTREETVGPQDKPEPTPQHQPEPTTSTPTTPSTKSQPDSDRSKTTLFVSSIPYTATSESLQAFFSEIGPVRSCFAVADRAQEGKNRGYGYVTYALPEDAERAVKDLKKVKFEGTRTLRIELALRKKVATDRKAAGLPIDPEHTPKKPKKSKSEGETDVKPEDEDEKDEDESIPVPTTPRSGNLPQNLGAIEIHNLPEGLTKKQLYKKVRKFGEVQELVFPVPKVEASEIKKEDEEVETLPGVARVIYTTGREASAAVQSLHNHQYKGAQITAKDLYAEAKEARRSRLIVRNLAWKSEPVNLRKAFAKFGNVQDVTVPHAPDGKARGFGFVQMATVEEAEKAVEGVNGTEILGRAVAVDWALPKAWYDKSAQGVEEEGAGEAMDVDEKVEEVDGEETGGEAAAAEVDDAADEEDEEEEDSKAEVGVFEDDEEDDDEEEDGEEDGDEEGDQEANSDDDGVEVTYDDEPDTKSEDALKSSPAVKKEKPQKPKSELASKPDEKTTLFIRNLSFDTTQEELSAAFSTFGPLRYARITMDHTTGRSRGTAFVCFRSPDDAAKCLAEYEAAAKAAAILDQGEDATQKDTKSTKQQKKLQPTQSILMPEPSLTAKSTPFLLNNRFLNLTLAVPRTEATQLTQEGKLRRRAEDKRNLYLMREGVIFPDSEAAKSLTPNEISKRQASYAERKRLLATNPNLFMSRTRLSVRNLGLKVDDRELKKVGLVAVKRFWEEVGRGEREGLEEEVVEEERKEGRGVPGKGRKVNVKQAKILRSKDRMDATTGQLRSLGYGFIEFNSHADALACLRWLNNNARVFAPQPSKDKDAAPGAAPATDGDAEVPKGKRPIVEFAIENQLVIKRREDRSKGGPRESQGKGTFGGKRKREEEGGEEEGGDRKRKSIREVWKEREARKKERKAEKEAKAKKGAEGGKKEGGKKEGGKKDGGFKKDVGAKKDGGIKKDGGATQQGGKKEVQKAGGKRKRNDDDNANTNTSTDVTAQNKSEKQKNQKSPAKAQPAPKPQQQSQPKLNDGEGEEKKKKKKGKGGQQSKAQQRDAADEEKFSSLVKKYKKDLFFFWGGGGGGVKCGGGGGGEGGEEIKRWFS
ncbi:RNA recognition motif-containing protein [Rhizophlyctis rosea]|nr:RNA recognition motif-containing protein [Rhizophlyctis rosea]